MLSFAHGAGCAVPSLFARRIRERHRRAENPRKHLPATVTTLKLSNAVQSRHQLNDAFIPRQTEGRDGHNSGNPSHEYPVLWPTEVKDHGLLCSDFNLCSPSIFKLSAALNRPIPKLELLDIQSQWFENWPKIVTDITVPHLHAMLEHDRLWEVNEEIMVNFKKCPKMEVAIIPEAPHCVALSLQADAWYVKSFAFALKCDAAMEMENERP